ncbi:hypothetical protein ALC57_10083, partial [Trachymyrmex cornetzi]
KINLHTAKQYNHGTCNCIFLKRSFFRVTSREEVVMQLALGRKTGSANHPTCLFPFFFFSFRLVIRRQVPGTVDARPLPYTIPRRTPRDNNVYH